MKKQSVRFFILSVIILVLSVSCAEDDFDKNLESKTKVVLRNLGHELLLSQNDSTSLVLPVIKSSDDVYSLSFEKSLSFDPLDLQLLVHNSVEKLGLPKDFYVEVIRCDDKEVAYSYLSSSVEASNIFPCSGRLLPKSCFVIQFNYTGVFNKKNGGNPVFYLLVFLVLAFLAFVFYSRYIAYTHEVEHVDANVKTLGSFYFYPDQNKLVKAATEINLSKKECELLTILVTNANQIVTREILEKQVWEDHGVVVGRSLDTYISKLRKKLKSDDDLKITNIHGVGYKLEVSE
ncbi:two-component system response regulator [unidentified eubacterium SCB49]|nr:two-component system response regulator [unidentified eubacterium SCB49]